MVEYRKSAHTVYLIKYHFVFITKYRKPVLKGDIAKRVREIIREICRSNDIEIVRGHVWPTHVHLMLSVPPSIIGVGSGHLSATSVIPPTHTTAEIVA